MVCHDHADRERRHWEVNWVFVRNGHTVRQRQLGRLLRELREQAGLSLGTAAPKLDFSSSKLSRIAKPSTQASRLPSSRGW